MVMFDKGYMISHMRNSDNSVNIKNVVLGASCEASEAFQCMLMLDENFEDWMRFIDRLEVYLKAKAFNTIHDLCQTMYGMKHRNEELEGLYLVREDPELCELYYQVFVGLLDINLSTVENMTTMKGEK